MRPLFIDGFAGGGGASTGIAQAIGRDVDIAINHSPSAIAIHRANHPDTEHHCQDIRAVWPRIATRNRHVAGAWFSPDCKEFSKAKGGSVKERHIRMLAMEIPHWLEETQPDVVYVENVEEFEDWGPLEEGEDGKWRVITELKGEDFKRWLRMCRRLGYRTDHRQLRACDYGAPTSRKRLYIVMRRDKKPIKWPRPTHGRPGSPGVVSGKLLPYRTAAECIDWSIPCPSIFERVRDLKEATLRRIAHGVMRYVVNAAHPFIIPVTHGKSPGRAHDGGEPLRTVTTANGGEFAAVDATLAPHITKFHTGSVGSPMDKEMPVVTANGQPTRPAGANPLGLVGATLVGVGGRRGQSPPIPANGPAATLTTKADEALVAAHLHKMAQNGVGKDPEEPLDTAMAGAAKHAIVGATLYRTRNGERPGQEPRALDPQKPLGVVAAESSGFGLATVQAAAIDRQFGNSTGAAASEPLGATMSGGQGKSAAVTAFLSSFYGSDKAASGGNPEMPLRTARAGGGRGGGHHAVVTAHIEQANGGPRNKRSAGTSAARPFSTITATGSQQRIVETTLIEEGALPPELMERAVRVAAFLVKYYGEGGQSQAADRPMDVVTTKARYAVVTVTIDAVTYVIVDIGLRMLKPRELARAQGFPEGYILDPIVRKFLRGKWVEARLTIAEQISAIGNSVCPPVARALVAANQPELLEQEQRLAA